MNPELRRNLWLELTTHRLVAMPGVLVLVFAMVVATSTDWPPALYSTAVGLFLVLVHLWGARQASEAVTEEVRDRTWDWQRLSALAPWEMAWGKLAGATAFTWYGAAFCLLAMGVAVANGAGRGHAGSLALAVGLVASGIALHGALLAASLQAARKDSRLGYRLGTAMLVPALLVAGSFWFMGSHAGRDAGVVSWMGENLERITFLALSALAFAGWAVLAAYRQMCAELRTRTLPWAWPLFALFLSWYLAGFMPRGIDTRASFITVAFFTAVALTYYALFTDRITAMSLRGLVVHGQAGQWRRVIEEMPLPVPTLALAILWAALAPWAISQYPFGSAFQKLAAYPVALVLFLVRDTGLLAFFCLGPKPRRVEGVTLLYIVLLDWVLPALLRAIGLGAVATALVPIGVLDGWQAALVSAIQAALVWAAVAWRWHRAFGRAAKV